MQNSSSSWLNSRDNNNYYNPILKIRSLIHNLDAELMQLCNQCAIPKVPHSQSRFTAGSQLLKGGTPTSSNNTGSANSLNSLYNKAIAPYKPNKPNNKMIASSDISTTPGIQTRTLAGVYRSRVIDAYRNRRIFTVYGNYHTIRRALLRRGWIERMPPNRYQKLQSLPEDVLLQHAKKGNEFEAVAISKIINNFPSFFIWQSKAQRDVFAEVSPYRNRVRRSRSLDFSTKVGLIGCAEKEPWYRQENVCGMRYPRFYRLSGLMEERVAFIEDYRMTQCLCLLRYIKENANMPEELMDEDGTIDITTINFALTHIKKFLQELEHKSLDDSMPIDNTENIDWSPFIEDAHKIINKKAKFKGNWKLLSELVKLGNDYLERMLTLRPDYAWDGVRNLWILKPGYQCRGLNIVIKNNLDEIISWANNNNTRRYIAQKYVERPLLIYNTKFDIRQYMLLSIGESTVSIWLYKDCYLRFSSQDFTMEDLRESIHITNNSVQKKYRPKQNRDNRLPRCNMWSLEQFKGYLRRINAPDDIWETHCFNGFKKILIAVVMASLESTDFAENSFELYGCDFMIDEGYEPILIEINSTPDLSPSTEVTARICPVALKDLVRVIVDLPRNSQSSTGLFEMIHEVNYRGAADKNLLESFEITGKKMTLCKPEQKNSTQLLKSKYFRKPLKALKKAEAAIKSLKRGPYNGPQGANIISNRAAAAKKSPANSNKINAGPKVLKSHAKQALAIRYTKPH